MTLLISKAHIQIKDLAEPFPIHNKDTKSYLQSISVSSDIDKEETTILATETSTSSPRRKKRRRRYFKDNYVVLRTFLTCDFAACYCCRTAAQIDRKYRCTYPGCTKAYGTEGSLTQHQRLKHIRSSYNPSRKNVVRCIFLFP